MPDDELPEWAHPDVYGRMWTVGELADALANLGWHAETSDPNALYLHDETTEHTDDETNEVVFITTTEERLGQPLSRYHAWVSPDGSESFRLPRDRARRIGPLEAACVVALMAL